MSDDRKLAPVVQRYAITVCDAITKTEPNVGECLQRFVEKEGLMEFCEFLDHECDDRGTDPATIITAATIYAPLLVSVALKPFEVEAEKDKEEAIIGAVRQFEIVLRQLMSPGQEPTHDGTQSERIH